MKTLALLFAATALAGIALPVPEDVPLLAAGVGVRDLPSFAALCAVGIAGVLCRDTLFFAVGRGLGEAALSRPWVARLLGAGRIASARESVRSRGGRAVLAARCSVGVRSVSFFVAGALGVRIRDFFLYDGLGALVTVPVTVGLGALVGAPALSAAAWAGEHSGVLLALVGLLAAAWVARELTPADAEAEGSRGEERPDGVERVGV